MSNQAAIPAAIPYVSLEMVLRALLARTQSHLACDSLPSVIGQSPARKAAVSANPINQERDESCVPARVFRSVSRLLFGHGFGAKPAPCGNSLFCFGYHPSRSSATCPGPRYCTALKGFGFQKIFCAKNTKKISRTFRKSTPTALGSGAHSPPRHAQIAYSGTPVLASLRARVSRGQSGQIRIGEMQWHSMKTKSL